MAQGQDVDVERQPWADRGEPDQDRACAPHLRAKKLPSIIFTLRDILAIVTENSHIEAVTFDMFGTLVQWTNGLDDRHAWMWSEASNLLGRYGLTVAPEEFRVIRDKYWYPDRLGADACGREIDAAAVLILVVHDLARRQGLTLSPARAGRIAAELEDLMARVDLETLVILSEAREVLSGLKARQVKIGLISNYPYSGCAVRAVLEKANLLHFFDIVLVSSTEGYAKSEADPEHTIFSRACALLGIWPHAALHVGDDASTDFRAPRRFGMNAVVCANSEWDLLSGCGAGICPGPPVPEHNEVERFKEQSRDRLLSSWRRHAWFADRGTRDAGSRLYEISRDLVSPVLIGFAEDNLDHLLRRGPSLNLCLGRDGLAGFLVQRKLIEQFPERYGNIDPMAVRYLSVSRRMAAESTDALLSQFLNLHGVSSCQSITLIDFGLVGSIQNRLHALYPAKTITGRYLIAHRLWGDVLAKHKAGFLVQTDGAIPFGSAPAGLNVTGGRVDASLACVFLSLDFIHFFEAIWNGIYESSERLIDDAGLARPANHGAKIPATPGSPRLVSGMSDSALYHLFKRIALRGIVDGVVIYRKRRRAGVNISTDVAIRHLADWFVRTGWHDCVDRRVVKALAPAFFDDLIPADSDGNPAGMSVASKDYGMPKGYMYI